MMIKDKVDHFMYCFFLTKLCMFFVPMVYAIGIVLLIGIGKEIYDKVSKKGTCDWKDIVADLAGIVAAHLS